MTFIEMGFKTSKSGVCPKCGKRATRANHFYQTLNPFNKNADGTLKSSAEIIAEEREKSKVWKALPTFHARCEP